MYTIVAAVQCCAVAVLIEQLLFVDERGNVSVVNVVVNCDVGLACRYILSVSLSALALLSHLLIFELC
jgi:hypothetical protein